MKYDPQVDVVLPEEEESPDYSVCLPWQSRRFWITLAGPLVAVIISQVPALADSREELMKVITYVATAMVGGFTLTHAAGSVGSVLSSRRFWIGIGTLVLDVVVALWPGLADIRVELINLIGIGGSTLITGLTVTDFAAIKGWTPKA